jgi:hypothetical protein
MHGQGHREELEKLRGQRAALAAFGGHALRERDLDVLLNEAGALVSDACGIELVKVLELLPDGETMLVRAGVNWKDGVVGQATMPAHSGSPGGHALDARAPVISRDVEAEDRFAIPDLLRDHGVRSMVNVMIECEHGPRGRARGRQPPADRLRRGRHRLPADLCQPSRRRDRPAPTHGELEGALERGRMLQAELKHPGRNLLATIEALAARTLKSSPDLTPSERPSAAASPRSAARRTC